MRRTKNATEVFQCVREFQKRAVSHWNPHIDKVSEINDMGLVGIDEASSDDAGSLALHFCEKFGMIEADNNGGWDLAENWERKCGYLFGDVKTVDNVEKLMVDLSNSPLSMKNTSKHVSVFAKCFQRLRMLPGDWYAGMVVLGSINKILWDTLLAPFLTALE